MKLDYIPAALSRAPKLVEGGAVSLGLVVSSLPPSDAAVAAVGGSDTGMVGVGTVICLGSIGAAWTAVRGSTGGAASRGSIGATG